MRRVAGVYRKTSMHPEPRVTGEWQSPCSTSRMVEFNTGVLGECLALFPGHSRRHYLIGYRRLRRICAEQRTLNRIPP